MTTKHNCWNPSKYNEFKDERSKPFFDLLSCVKGEGFASVVDLGCGTGELTKLLHDKVKSAHTLGIDSSESMLIEANKFKSDTLAFENIDINKFNPADKFDLIFANASLQWVPDHYKTIPKIISYLQNHGQIAIQMPDNHDHITHNLAEEVALELFPIIFKNKTRPFHVLKLEEYASIFYNCGLSEQLCFIKIYGQAKDSTSELIEWSKGTLLTYYQGFLTDNEFAEFLKLYQFKMEKNLGSIPYFYPFKRMILWGKLNK
jgi:trans-aconitate 2-methyltransferase